MQKTAKKCTKVYHARGKLLFCLLYLFFGEILVAILFVGTKRRSIFVHTIALVQIIFVLDLQFKAPSRYRVILDGCILRRWCC